MCGLARRGLKSVETTEGGKNDLGGLGGSVEGLKGASLSDQRD